LKQITIRISDTIVAQISKATKCTAARLISRIKYSRLIISREQISTIYASALFTIPFTPVRVK